MPASQHCERQLSSVWVLLCRISSEIWQKVSSHLEQEYDFLPRWTLWCLVRCDLQTNPLSQSGHRKGFSPACIFLWWIRPERERKLLPQSKQAYGFSPVWTLWCRVRSGMEGKLFSHAEQAYRMFPMWVLRWFNRRFLRLKLSPQSEHWNRSWFFSCLMRLEAWAMVCPTARQAWGLYRSVVSANSCRSATQEADLHKLLLFLGWFSLCFFDQQ